MMSAFTHIDDALEHWAHQTPDAPALRLMGQVTTYKELNEMANRMAATLMSEGVRRGDRVALHAAKSQRAIAAVYGVLRVGAMYVPIDPSAPIERVKAQIKTTAPTCILADEIRARKLTEAGIKCLRLENLGDLQTDVDVQNLHERARERDPSDGAYILMTSGSTGAPKGILHTHKSGLAYAKMSAALCELSPSDRVSHHTPLYFDMSIFDIFATAQAGACVVIIPEMHTKMPASLASLVEQEQITVWYSVPYALIQLIERGALETKDLSSLRIVMFAGETMPPVAIKAFAGHVPAATFINAYGPTETNHCISAKFRREDLDGSTALPIGRADVGVRARLAETAQGVDVGELLIASDQVMQGYWQDLERSKQMLIPLKDDDGSTRNYYRTGDIVRRAGDGTFTLLGRADRQIKLRGYRIELDEIERALTTTAGVTEAAVVFEGGRILAFYTGTTVPDTSFVKTHIAQVLPPYAQPEHIIGLDQFSRTSTGKIDRNTLIGQFNGQ